MNAFQFHLPTRILFGSDTIAQTGEAVKAAGGSQVLVLYGTGSVQRNGVLDKVLAALDGQKIPYCVEGGIQPNPRLAKAQALADTYAGKGIDFLLGVGGASVLDTCKAVAIGLACGFGAVTVVAMQFLAEALVGLFTPDQAAVLAGGQYLRGYIWDSFFAGVQFSFSGYFCACGRSGLSFLHNFLSIVCVRIPGAYLTSRLFPQTLLPMGLANAAGSLFSICARWICPRRRLRTSCRTATWAASRRSFASRSRRSPGGSRSSRASSARSTTACASCARRRRRSST